MKYNTAYGYCFKTPNNYYFYDVNKDTIVLVQKPIYEWLKGDNSYDMLSDEYKQQVDKFQLEGFFSSNRIEELCHPETDNLTYHLSRRIEQLTLQVTQACNLVCYYCPYANKTENTIQRNHSNSNMTWEVAKKALDFFAARSVDINEVSIGFYGGEPLLNIDLIRKSVKYAHEIFWGKGVSFHITTNGTVMDDKIISFLVENQFNVMFSIDGPPSIHDINRRYADGKGSFNAAFSNFKRLVEAYGDDYQKRVSINMVLNQENDPSEVVKLFDNCFFKRYTVNITVGAADDELLDKDLQATERYVCFVRKQAFFQLLKYLEIVPEIVLNPMFENQYLMLGDTIRNLHGTSNSLPQNGAPGGPCIPGQRRLFVSTDGKFYPCERVSELSSLMIIGDVDYGFNIDKASALLNICRLTPEKCRNCFALRHCKVCAAAADSNGVFSIDKRNKRCLDVQTSLKHDLRLCALSKELSQKYRRW